MCRKACYSVKTCDDWPLTCSYISCTSLCVWVAWMVFYAFDSENNRCDFSSETNCRAVLWMCFSSSFLYYGKVTLESVHTVQIQNNNIIITMQSTKSLSFFLKHTVALLNLFWILESTGEVQWIFLIAKIKHQRRKNSKIIPIAFVRMLKKKCMKQTKKQQQ